MGRCLSYRELKQGYEYYVDAYLESEQDIDNYKGEIEKLEKINDYLTKKLEVAEQNFLILRDECECALSMLDNPNLTYYKATKTCALMLRSVIQRSKEYAISIDQVKEDE